MQPLRNISSLTVPNFTPEQWAKINERCAEFDKRERKARLAERLEKTHIPTRFLNAKITEKPVAEWVENVKCGRGDWLILQGNNGVFKTTQGCAGLQAVCEVKRAEFCTMQGIINAYKDNIKRPTSAIAVLNHYNTTPVLMIDDFGKETKTEWSLNVIFTVIDNRYSLNLPTLITTNLTWEQLGNHLVFQGDEQVARAVLSRLHEARLHVMSGKDRRLS